MGSAQSPASRDEVSISSLADRVSKLSEQITSYLNKNGHAQPDFSAASAPPPETFEYENLANQISDAALDLLRLVNGPKNTFRTTAFSHMDLAAAQVASRRNFYNHVPDDNVGLASAELAKLAGMDEDRATRFLKMLATHRIFEEVDGKWRHTAASAFLKTSEYAAIVDVLLDDCFKATSDMDAWVEESPHHMGLENSAFYKRFGTTFYGYYDVNPDKAERFSKAMKAWALIDCPFPFMRDAYNWASLQNPKIVDVGGGNGHVSIDLAREFSNLTFTVQDLSPQQLSTAQAAEVENRVTFQQANYFEPQTIRDAGIYLCRCIFHNQHDDTSIKVLQALIPALEGRTDDPRILINDIIVPERAGGPAVVGGKEVVTVAEENGLRQMDLLMLALFGAKERTEEDWKDLMRKADPRLEIVGMHYHSRGAGMLEVRLNTDVGEEVFQP